MIKCKWIITVNNKKNIHSYTVFILGRVYGASCLIYPFEVSAPLSFNLDQAPWHPKCTPVKNFFLKIKLCTLLKFPSHYKNQIICEMKYGNSPKQDPKAIKPALESSYLKIKNKSYRLIAIMIEWIAVSQLDTGLAVLFSKRHSA